MNIKRIVPDIESSNFAGCREFYGEYLGLDLVMDQGWVMTFASVSHPTSQVTILEPTSSEIGQPDISIEVDDVHQAHSEAKKRGLSIEYPLTSEAWGVTRFFVRDPNGKLLNILSHTENEPNS